jgi:uncharacterized metal-binding protein
MPIRFYLPLPGPFVWVPRRRAHHRSARWATVPTGALLAVLAVIVVTLIVLIIIAANTQ